MATYSNYFYSKDNNKYTLTLTNVPEGLTFEFAGDPLNISYQNSSSNIFKPVIYSSADIQIVTDRLNWDLYKKYAQESQVTITKNDSEVIYKGYLSGDILDQSTQYTINQISLSAVDGLSTLEYYKWDRTGSATVKDILINILSKAGYNKCKIEKNWGLLSKNGTTTPTSIIPTQAQLKTLYAELKESGHEEVVNEDNGSTVVKVDGKTLIMRMFWSKPHTESNATYIWYGDNEDYYNYFGGGGSGDVVPSYNHPAETIKIVQDIWNSEDDTYKDVLESIMTFLNLSAVVIGDTVYCFDYINVGQSNTFYDLFTGQLTTESNTATVAKNDIRSSGSISITQVIRKCEISGNLDMTNLIPAVAKSSMNDRTTWTNWTRGTYNQWTGYLMEAQNTNWKFYHATGSTYNIINDVHNNAGGYYLTVGDENGKERTVKSIISTGQKSKSSTVIETSGNYGNPTNQIKLWSGNSKKIYHITTGYQAIEIEATDTEIYCNPLRITGNLTYGNDLKLSGKDTEIMIPCTIEFGNWILVSYKANNTGEPWASNYIYYEGGVDKYYEDFGKYPLFYLSYDSTGQLKNNMVDNTVVYDDGFYIVPPAVTESTTTEQYLNGCVEGKFKMTIWVPESKYNFNFFGIESLGIEPVRLGVDTGLDYSVSYSNVLDSDVIGKEEGIDFDILVADKDATTRNMPFYNYKYYNNIDRIKGVTMDIFMNDIILKDNTSIRPEQYAIKRIVEQYSDPCKIIKIRLHKPLKINTQVTMPQGEFMVANMSYHVKDEDYEVELIENKSATEE